MKLWIFSDLHLEFSPLSRDFAAPDADVCLVAGDVCVGGPAKAIRIVQDLVPHEMPVIFVAGNHEFYRSFLSDGLIEGRAATRRSNFHFLENDAVRIGDVFFAGATLWTDFDLHGAAQLAMKMCGASMNDYRSIRFSKRPFSKLTPVVTLAKHIESRHFIAGFLHANCGEKTVVVTHHAPSSHALPGKFSLDIHSAAYASNLDALIEKCGPTLWVHGHVHERSGYRIGKTRLIANPRGYVDEASYDAFDSAYVVDV